jgi:hypothetical protein
MQSRSPITEQSDWFNKQYGVTAANSTAVLRHAKHEFTNGAIDRAIRCLDLYVRLLTIRVLKFPCDCFNRADVN